MKKLNYRIAALALIGSVLFAACEKQRDNNVGPNDDNTEARSDESTLSVPTEISNAFKRDFPQGANAQWEKEGTGFEVKFVDNSENKEAEYDAAGTLMVTETKIDPASLSQTIKDHIQANYAGYELEEAEKLVKPETGTFYEIEIEKEVDNKETKLELLYDEQGNFVNEQAEEEDEDNGEEEDEEEDEDGEEDNEGIDNEDDGDSKDQETGATEGQ